MKKLTQAPRGQNCRIIQFTCKDEALERLLEMGLSEGQIVTVQGQAPFKGPWILQAGSTLLALRENEAQSIHVEMI
ncbi:MAG: ferrous iron transport protein A [Pseudobdellovibrionaceae bacterium]